MASLPLITSNPQPADVGRTRVGGQSPMDMWDSFACGLIQEGSRTGPLTALHFGSPGDVARPPDGTPILHEGHDPNGEATTYLLTEPTYVPYESSEVPRHATGDSLGRQALSAVFSPEVLAGAKASPLTATVLAAAVSVRANLVPTASGRLLTALAAVTPKKGGELDRLVPEYCARNAEKPEQAAIMAMRDYFASWFAWCFPRCADGRMLDLWGSVCCLTTAVDYTDVADSAGGGDSAAYLAAASEGLACLGGKAATQVLRDLVAADAFMKAKEEAVAASGDVANPECFLNSTGGPVTPNEVLRARIWDGVYYVILRAIMSTSSYKHLTDELGVFSAADKCGNIKRALDNGIRYNEIVDLASDYAQQEWLSEVCLALAMGGGGAVLGYADACARATDAAIVCDCGENGHEVAAEVSMGNLLFYLVTPRYVVRRQLAALSAVGGSVRNAYAWREPGTRLRAVARTRLSSGDVLHSPTWQPLWTHLDPLSGDDELPDVDELAQRAVRRSLPDGRCKDAADDCVAAAKSVLTACDRLREPASLRALTGQWCRFFDTVLGTSAADSTARHQAQEELRPLIARIWRQAIVGYEDLPTDPADCSDERLYLDTDRAIRRTYALAPSDGLAIRRAFLGVTTSAAEFSGCNPCARLADGAARMILGNTEAFTEALSA